MSIRDIRGKRKNIATNYTNYHKLVLKLEQISAIRGKKNKCQFVTFVAKKLLDWEPQVDFLTGLRQTIEYVQREMPVKSSEWVAAS